MNLDLNWIVAIATIGGFGLKLVSIGVAVLNKINSLDSKLEVGLTQLNAHGARMDRQDERLGRIESRVERLEQQGETA